MLSVIETILWLWFVSKHLTCCCAAAGRAPEKCTTSWRRTGERNSSVSEVLQQLDLRVKVFVINNKISTSSCSLSVRRAHLKECFETLKKNIPNIDEKKTSNLSVLRSALRYIQVREEAPHGSHELVLVFIVGQVCVFKVCFKVSAEGVLLRICGQYLLAYFQTACARWSSRVCVLYQDVCSYKTV